jgi:hypothetical protein
MRQSKFDKVPVVVFSRAVEKDSGCATTANVTGPILAFILQKKGEKPWQL